MNAEEATRKIRARATAEDGFTIIEALVTAIVVAVVMGATFGAIQAAGRAGADQRHRAESYAIAQKDQARMRSMRISQVKNLNQTTTTTLNGTTYSIQSQGQFVNDVTGTASCEEGTNSSDYIVVTSTVTWPSLGAAPPTVIKSIVSPPAGSLDETKGALAVVVRNGAGAGIPGFSVSGSGSGTFSGSTGSTGCILFTDLPEGPYTLTPNSSGRVDADGNPPSPMATSVVGQSTNTLVLRYDTPGAIKVDFKARLNGTVQTTQTDLVTVFNTGMTQEKAFGTLNSNQSNVTAGSLFPFTSPYAVYAGACDANNPNPNGLANPPAAAAIASVNVVPGQTANASIQLPVLGVTVMSGAGSSSPGSVVTNAPVKITSSECTIGGNPAVNRTLTTNSLGKIETALPYGTYDICAYRASGNRRGTATGVAVQTTSTNTAQTVYTGGTAPGSANGPCP
ncbi:MAG: hypothetical protein U0R51_03995 [Solirubrobacterales bacterium]